MAKASLYSEKTISKYTNACCWDQMGLSDYWVKNARESPDKEALVDYKTRLTWSQARLWMERLALGFLELGLKKDDRVILQLPNTVDTSLFRVACERAGLLYIPVLRSYRHTEMKHILRQTESAAIVIPWKYKDFDYLAMVKELMPDFPSLKHIFIVGDEAPEGTISIKDMLNNPLESRYSAGYLDSRKCPSTDFSMVGVTTGTTGTPKLVEMPMCSWLWSAKADNIALKLTGKDIIAALGPAAVGPNIPVYFGGPMVAAKSVFLENWSVKAALELIEKEKVTLPCVVPAQLAEIAHASDLGRFDLSSIRVIWCAGAPLPFHVAVEIEDRLGCPIVQGYGATDFGGISIVSIEWPREFRLLTVGFPHTGNEIKLVDSSGKKVKKGGTGEILVRGPTGTSGYYGDPAATAKFWDKDGWYHTGDLGKWGEEGHLCIAGREKDMIIRGGQNIYPAEVENLLVTHPKVLSAAIVGIPDPIMGEKACACVVVKPGETFTMEEMVSFLKTRRIVAYKLPEKLVLMDALPLVQGLKLDKKALREKVALLT